VQEWNVRVEKVGVKNETLIGRMTGQRDGEVKLCCILARRLEASRIGTQYI